MGSSSATCQRNLAGMHNYNVWFSSNQLILAVQVARNLRSFRLSHTSDIDCVIENVPSGIGPLFELEKKLLENDVLQENIEVLSTTRVSTFPLRCP